MNRLLRVLAVAWLTLLPACLPQPRLPGTSLCRDAVNLGDVKTAVTAYHDSGRYLIDVATVALQAEHYLEQRVGEQDARHPARLAIILDIDETALTNWDGIKPSDFGYVPAVWNDWVRKSAAPALAPVLDLSRDAHRLGVAIFFISGRRENQRTATELNLQRAGYSNWEAVVLQPDGAHFPSAADFKGPERARIVANGWTIVENVGDQPSDLLGGYAERSFLIPDPFYRVP